MSKKHMLYSIIAGVIILVAYIAYFHGSGQSYNAGFIVYICHRPAFGRSCPADGICWADILAKYPLGMQFSLVLEHIQLLFPQDTDLISPCRC